MMAFPTGDTFPQYDPVADPASVVQGDHFRFTVLSEALIRLEYSLDGFEDRPSSFAVNRRFPRVSFQVEETATRVDIYTSQVWLQYVKGPFKRGTLTANLQQLPAGHWGERWQFGEPAKTTRPGNLGGTVRTLDRVNGRCDMSNGIMTMGGIAQVDDHDSMLFDGDWVASRRPGRYDGYLFCHGFDRRWALRDFFALSGRAPVPPRYALGVWYTRFYPYTTDEYLGVMDKFKESGVNLSVAVIDIAWHIMDKTPKGTGGAWSGFTWEPDYYPDPDQFLQALKDRGLIRALNDHPNEGIRYFEDSYEDVCKALNRDPAKKLPIPFEASNKEIIRAYFDIVLRRLEKQGVDLWWLDWQQNDHSALDNVDPLWILNHFHFIDHAKTGQRAMTLSRFAGPGSHRYPLGFSGDHQMTWESLDFEPEFTATASNIGYGWWSHDIGGHLDGYRDGECTARWCQLGVVMPVLRLHCNCNPFNYRTPWLFPPEVRDTMILAFQLRHRLIPYLYTEAVEASLHDRCLMEPMYYDHPLAAEAYTHRNAYMFGRHLIAAPITKKVSEVTHLGSSTAWLPPGTWVDILSGLVYDGDRIVSFHRPLSTFPLLAKAGTIIPMDATKQDKHGVYIPESIELILVVGADAEYTLIEDDGRGNDMTKVDHVRTHIEYKGGVLTVKGPPRNWSVSLPGTGVSRIEIGRQSSFTCKIDAKLAPNDWKALSWDILDRSNMDFGVKEHCWNALRGLFNSVIFYTQTWHQKEPTPNVPRLTVISRLRAVGVPKDLEDALMELLLAME